MRGRKVGARPRRRRRVGDRACGHRRSRNPSQQSSGNVRCRADGRERCGRQPCGSHIRIVDAEPASAPAGGRGMACRCVPLRCVGLRFGWVARARGVVLLSRRLFLSLACAGAPLRQRRRCDRSILHLPMHCPLPSFLPPPSALKALHSSVGGVLRSFGGGIVGPEPPLAMLRGAFLGIRPF